MSFFGEDTFWRNWNLQNSNVHYLKIKRVWVKQICYMCRIWVRLYRGYFIVRVLKSLKNLFRCFRRGQFLTENASFLYFHTKILSYVLKSRGIHIASVHISVVRLDAILFYYGDWFHSCTFLNFEKIKWDWENDPKMTNFDTFWEINNLYLKNFRCLRSR